MAREPDRYRDLEARSQIGDCLRPRDGDRQLSQRTGDTVSQSGQAFRKTIGREDERKQSLGSLREGAGSVPLFILQTLVMALQCAAGHQAGW